MAKKFLDLLADAYEEEELDQVIPTTQKSSGKKPRTTKSSGSSRRKKRFRDSITEALPPEPRKTGRKSLLQTMEEALESEAFDNIFPEKPHISRDKEQKDLEIRFSTMITSEVLNRARQIAEQKKIRVKDVINMALRMYVEQEWESLQ